MTQNRSTAVMARRIEPHDSLDDFPTQPWATRALCEHVIGPHRTHIAWDPAANRGHMVAPLKEYFLAVSGSDIHDYGAGFPVHDFLFPYMPDGIGEAEWIITNPPFRLALQFIHRALDVASHGVAVFVRTGFLEGIERYTDLYSVTPPTVIAHFAERVPLVRGKLDPEAASATAYCWIVWAKGIDPRPPVWIPPCRKSLERPEDYSAYAETLEPMTLLDEAAQ